MIAKSVQGPMERLVTVLQELSLARDVPAVMAIVRHAARALTGADGASFVLREGDQCYYADEEAIGPLWKGQRFPMSACLSGWVMHHRQHAVIEDIYADSRIPAEAYAPAFHPSTLQRALRNLVQNALEAMPEAGDTHPQRLQHRCPAPGTGYRQKHSIGGAPHDFRAFIHRPTRRNRVGLVCVQRS